MAIVITSAVAPRPDPERAPTRRLLRTWRPLLASSAARRWWLPALTLIALLSTGPGFVPVAFAEPPSPSPATSSTAADQEEDEDQEDEDSADEDDPEQWLEVDTLCAGAYRGAEVQVNSDVDGAEGERYEWTLLRNGTEIRRESFTYSEADEGQTGPENFDDLAPGDYSLQVTRAGQTALVIGIEFEILRCVDAVAGCRSVTFTNPADNPALGVEYGPGEDDESDDEDVHDTRVLTLQPGESRTVTTLRRVAGWAASRVYRPNQNPSFGGEDYQLGVEQHCGDTMTRGVVGCAPNGKSNGTVDVWFAPPRDRPARFRILDFHELVDSGPVGDDNRLRLRLPPSYYNLRAYTSAATLPYDRADFYILPCLRVTSTCDGVSFRNSFWSDVDVIYQVNRGAAKSIRIKGDRTTELPLPAGAAVSWRTVDREVEDLAGWTVDAGHGRAVAGQCGRQSGELAATGAADRSLTGQLLLGVALILAGVVLLRVDRRRG